MKIYGSLINRLEENRQAVPRIKVGDGVTIYGYSDRYAYEVVDVIDQNHIKIRELDHIAIGEPMSNEWELVPNEKNPVETFSRRKNGYWYKKIVWTRDKTTYIRTNLSIGKAEYYYDYEF